MERRFLDRPIPHRFEPIVLAEQPAFEFGCLVIDPAAHEARYAAQRESVQPQPLKVLLALIERRGCVVTRQELVDRCWHSRVVGDDVINRSILLLRGLAKRSGAFSIQTVPKSGYRLLETGSAPAKVWHRPIVVLIALLALAGTIVFGMVISAKRAGPSAPKIAVVPFNSGSSRPMRDLSSSIESRLVTMLSDSSLPVQRMVSDVSSSGDVDFILSGDLRQEGSTVVATMHLEDVRSKAILFSKMFRSPLAQSGGLPDQIGAYAAGNLTWAGTLRILDRRQSSDARLTTELLKQLFLTVEGKDLMRAYAISEMIAPKMPNSTMAQLGLAHNAAMIFDRVPSEQRPALLRTARQAAARARELSPEFGDVYTPACRLNPRVWLSECEASLRESLRVDPDGPYASAYLRRLLGEVGRNQEALRYARLSLANDPYKPGKLAGLIGRLEALGEQGEAATAFGNAVRWWPEQGIFYQERLEGMAQRGDFPAIARFAIESPATRFPAEQGAVIRLANAVADKRTGEIDQLCARKARSDAMGALCFVALVQIGEIDSAFRLAAELYPRRAGRDRGEEERLWIADQIRLPTTFLASPALERMRQDPRFVPLAKSVGLWRYWQRGRLPDFCRSPGEAVCRQIKRG